MSSEIEKNKAIVRRFEEELARGNLDVIDELASPDFGKASLDLHPLGRLGEPADIAAAIAYLLGPESGWVTGQTIGVDGGLSTLRPPIGRQAKA